MKRLIILTVLLCLALAVGLVSADAPAVISGLKYDGSYQSLVTAGTVTDPNRYQYFYRNPFTGKWDTSVPSQKFPGNYKVEYVLADIQSMGGHFPPEELSGTVIGPVTIAEVEPPEGLRLAYDGTVQRLIKPGVIQQVGSRTRDIYCYRYSDGQEWREIVPEASDPNDVEMPEGRNIGKYTIQYIMAEDSCPAQDVKSDFSLVAEIYDPAKETPTAEPTSTADPTSTGEPAPTSEPTSTTEPAPTSVPTSTTEPVPTDVPDHQEMIFYRIGSGSSIFDSDMDLPATGFSTRFHQPLSVQPANVKYETLEMRIQIPTINVDAELTGVPAFGSSWAVEWLSDRAGLLSGSALPGDGYAVVAAHNHLNLEEMGPFGLLFSLDENDRIFVNTADGGLQIYSVYANELLEPDDVDKMAAIAQTEENTLVLVTCENEMIEGGYQNRRAVFAKPVM